MNKNILIILTLMIFLFLGSFFGFKYFQKEQITKLEEPTKELAEEPAAEEKIIEKEKEQMEEPREQIVKESAILDCKEDFDCLIQAAQTCQLAKLTFISIMEIFGIEQMGTTYYEIKGMENDKCLLYLRLEEVEMLYSGEFSGIIMEEIGKIYEQLKGRDGTCRFYPDELAAMLTKWSEGSFDSGTISCKLTPEGNICRAEGGDFEAGECQGAYFEYSL